MSDSKGIIKKDPTHFIVLQKKKKTIEELKEANILFIGIEEGMGNEVVPQMVKTLV